MANAPREEPTVPIELTEQQRQLVHQRKGRPVEVVDPQTHQTYVLIAQEHYDKVRSLLPSEMSSATPSEEDVAEIPPGILRSQQAFWRDLPQLLSQKKLAGKWVCYHGDDRVGIGRHDDLIRECLRRGIPGDQYDLFVIEPHAIPPWEPEEVEHLGPWHFEDVPPAS